MASHDFRANLASIAIFTLPVIVVKLTTAFLNNASPTQVLGSTVEPVSGSAVVSAAKAATWSDAQLAAARHIETLRAQPFGPTPLYHEVVQTPVDTTPPPVVVVPPRIKAYFVLNAVMSGDRGETALINLRPYRAGDQIADTGWVVESINSSRRTAVLREPATGETMNIKVQLPGAQSTEKPEPGTWKPAP
ncbi:MAG: hypothetical protein L0Y44_07780 [Phycisphaerales bacterium]|nr:hypothetical protein [Phycisphaerales bacterium]MCI0630536.1 hypothetical protein [Phycisphaerales bacterium]MCI0676461.1 hypothetical protein [Phycisphaerales bacterium]